MVYLRLIITLLLFSLSLSLLPYIKDEITLTSQLSAVDIIFAYTIFHIDSQLYLSASAFYQGIQYVNACNIQVLKKNPAHLRNRYLDCQRMCLCFSQKIRFDWLGLSRRNNNRPSPEFPLPILENFILL